MPITQSRMIALIDEAQELHGALRDLRQEVKRVASYLRDGVMSKEEAVVAFFQAEANSRTNDLEALPVEAAHFKKMQGHNQYRMLAQRAQRGGLRRAEPEVNPGAKQRPTAERILPTISPDREAMRKRIEAALAKDYEAPALPRGSILPADIEIEGGMPEIAPGTKPTDLL